MMRLLGVMLVLMCAGPLAAAEVIPPSPPQYFNDFTGRIDPQTVDRLNQKLGEFEQQTSNQIVVVVYQKMESDSDVADYTQHIFDAWRVGTKKYNNGVALFVFLDDRQMYIKTGYGLEGALPDATCKSIIEDTIKPHFQSNDYAGGLSAGVDAIVAATKGEYQASWSLASWVSQHGQLIIILIFVAIIVIQLLVRKAQGGSSYYSSSGYRRSSGFYWGSGWGGSSGGSWGGGGGGFTFSGGGGMSGGGGAGGSW